MCLQKYWYHISFGCCVQDLAGLDSQFQTFTEVFESVVSGFEAAKEKDVYGVYG